MFFYRHVKNCHPSIKELKCLFRGCQFAIKVIIITKTVATIAIIIFSPSIWPPICSFLYTTKLLLYSHQKHSINTPFRLMALSLDRIILNLVWKLVITLSKYIKLPTMVVSTNRLLTMCQFFHVFYKFYTISSQYLPKCHQLSALNS